MCYETTRIDSKKFYNTLSDMISVPCLINNAANTVARTVNALMRYKPGHEGPRPEDEEVLLNTWGLKEMGKPLSQEALNFWQQTTDESRDDGHILIYDQEGRVAYQGPVNTKVVDGTDMEVIYLSDGEGMFYALSVNL